MGAQKAVLKPQEPPPAEEYYTWEEETSDRCFTIYKIRINSDEARAYVKLTSDEKRLKYMRLHAHAKIEYVSPKYIFYEDSKSGKRFCIRTNTPECAEAERLIGDSDEELVAGTERGDRVLRYFETHAHQVESIS